jgi:hypothetical protein
MNEVLPQILWFVLGLIVAGDALAAAGSIDRMAISRIAEVGWGLAVGVSLVWLANRFQVLFRTMPED